MKVTNHTLLEQMRITDFEIANRKGLFSFSAADEAALDNARPYLERHIPDLVQRFYALQTDVPGIALVIGDSETLDRLHSTQRKYVQDLLSGCYDIEYVSSRLRIGMVHKRIGVEHKLYLSSMETLSELLADLVRTEIADANDQARILLALQKLMMFDISLVFDTYTRSMVSELESAREKEVQYARVLEEKVKERTEQLEILSRTDSLTGLLNVRHLNETLTRMLRAAHRRSEPVTLAYIDVNDFKMINDTQGHQVGDDILRRVAQALKAASRLEDQCFRYGGDEFCVVMSNCQVKQAREVWEPRVVRLLQQHANCPALSIGYAHTGPKDYLSAEELIHQADEQMYAVKKAMKTEAVLAG